jgi:hypothetical protein
MGNPELQPTESAEHAGAAQTEGTDALGAALSDFAAKVTDEGDEAPVGDANVGGEAQAEAEPQSDAQPEASDDLTTRLAEIAELLKPKAEATATEKPGTEAKAAAKDTGDQVADALESVLAEELGEASGARLAKSIGATIEKIVAERIAKFAGDVKPVMDYAAGIAAEKQKTALNSENDKFVDQVLGPTIKSDPVLGNLYGSTRSAANAEQKALRDKVRETAVAIGPALHKQGKSGDEIVAAAEVLVRAEWQKANRSKPAQAARPGLNKVAPPKAGAGGVAKTSGPDKLGQALKDFASKLPE